MTRLIAAVGPFAPIVVLVLAAAESAAFVGVVVPGELAVILGGVTAGTGGASLWLMIPAAVVGAIAGDSIGYSLGRRVGPALLDRPKMARVSKRMDAAAEMLSERGWWALVVARFAAVLRAVVPFAAGMARMPYRRFLLGNAIGGALWGTTFTMVGYLAGANYPRVERWIRTGGLAVVVVVLFVGGIVGATRWIERNRDRVTARLSRFASAGPVRVLVAGIRQSRRPALPLALSGISAIAGMWVFGGLAQDVIGTEEFFILDLSVIRYLEGSQIPALIAIARVLNVATQPTVLVVGLLLATAVGLLFKRHRLIAAAFTACVGQWVIVELTASLVDRTAPNVGALVTRVDYGFPSEHVALVAAVAVVASWPWSRPSWRAIVTRFGAAIMTVMLVGTARVVLLAEYPSDVIAGAAVAAAWTLLVCLVFDPGTAELAPAAAITDLGAP